MLVRIHPITGKLIVPLGHIAGRPVWPIMGGSVSAPEAGTPAPGAPPATPPAQTPAQPPAPAPAPPAPGPAPNWPSQPPPAPPSPVARAQAGNEARVTDADTLESLAGNNSPEQLAALVLRLRGENGKSRTDAKAAAADQAKIETAQAIGRALGLVQVEEEVTPEVLQQRISESNAQLTASKVELEVYRTAAKHGGIPAALVDSQTFMASVRGADPTAPDFSDKVVAAVQAAITANPLLKAGQASVRSGTPFTGGPGEGRDESTLQPGMDRLRYAYETGR